MIYFVNADDFGNKIKKGTRSKDKKVKKIKRFKKEIDIRL